MITALLVSLLAVQAPPTDLDHARDALPEHELRKCGALQYMCFEFGPYKDLLGQSFERFTLLEQQGLIAQQLTQMREQVAALKAVVEVRNQQLSTWKEDHGRLLVKWTEENKLRHKAELKANSIWPVVTIVVGSVLGVSGALWGAFNQEDPAPWVLTGSGIVVVSVGAVDLLF